MAIEVTSPPACEPFSTEEAKHHLRIDLPDEDFLVDAAIVAARTYAENFMRRKLITQEVTITRTGFCLFTPLPIVPVQSITSIQYKQASDGVLTVLDAAKYQLVKSILPLHVAPAYDEIWPDVRDDFDSVVITVQAGYGDNRSDIPGDIMAAMRLLLGHFYENRQSEFVGTITSKLTLGADRMMMPHVLHV